MTEQEMINLMIEREKMDRYAAIEANARIFKLIMKRAEELRDLAKKRINFPFFIGTKKHLFAMNELLDLAQIVLDEQLKMIASDLASKVAESAAQTSKD